jgi:deoxyribose-phosphate aldolase
MNKTDLAKMIDHTVLKPEATKAQIQTLCEEAKLFHFFSVCIAPTWIELAKRALEGSSVKIVTVVGFPHGNTVPEAKAYEAVHAIALGANEVDMVIQVGKLKSREYDVVRKDIAGVVEVSKAHRVIVKAILEMSLLERDEKIMACRIAEEAGAAFVKTSTGFGSSGATVEDIVLIKEHLKGNTKIKAAGGIRDTKTALRMIEAGAHRIGTSTSVSILEGLHPRPKG